MKWFLSLHHSLQKFILHYFIRIPWQTQQQILGVVEGINKCIHSITQYYSITIRICTVDCKLLRFNVTRHHHHRNYCTQFSSIIAYKATLIGRTSSAVSVHKCTTIMTSILIPNEFVLSSLPYSHNPIIFFTELLFIICT